MGLWFSSDAQRFASFIFCVLSKTRIVCKAKDEYTSHSLVRAVLYRKPFREGKRRTADIHYFLYICFKGAS